MSNERKLTVYDLMVLLVFHDGKQWVRRKTKDLSATRNRSIDLFVKYGIAFIDENDYVHITEKGDLLLKDTILEWNRLNEILA